MLIDVNQIQDILKCPATGDALEIKESDPILLSTLSGNTYKSINQKPVLINFKSFLEQEHEFFKRQAASAIVREEFGKKKHNILKKMVRNPMHSTKNNMHQLMQMLTKSKDIKRLLIVGGGDRGYFTDSFYESDQIEVISFDIYYTENITFIADAHNIPLKNESVDAVIIQAVLEHVLEPQLVVEEIYRVLKSDGLVYAETPFMQPVHEGAYDFTRYTESGHRYLFKRFLEINSGASCGAGTNLMWAIEYFFRGLFNSKAIGKMGKLLFFWLKYFDSIINQKQLVDAANGVYFLGRKSDKVITPADAINRYQGAY
jgi:SAM-dependent methyltransferase